MRNHPIADIYTVADLHLAKNRWPSIQGVGKEMHLPRIIFDGLFLHGIPNPPLLA